MSAVLRGWHTGLGLSPLGALPAGRPKCAPTTVLGVQRAGPQGQPVGHPVGFTGRVTQGPGPTPTAVPLAPNIPLPLASPQPLPRVGVQHPSCAHPVQEASVSELWSSLPHWLAGSAGGHALLDEATRGPVPWLRSLTPLPLPISLRPTSFPNSVPPKLSLSPPLLLVYLPSLAQRLPTQALHQDLQLNSRF